VLVIINVATIILSLERETTTSPILDSQTQQQQISIRLVLVQDVQFSLALTTNFQFVRHKANLDATDSSILFNKSFKLVLSITTKCTILSYSSQKKNSIHFVTKPILTQAREEEENAQFSFVLHLKHFNFIPSSNQS
jgi:hypothetical protein